MFVVVVRRSGPQWDASRPLEKQSGWPEHAAFMDGLVDAGFIVLGGPLAAGDRVVHIVDADSEEAIRTTLSPDPWSETHLVIDSIDRWIIRLDGRPHPDPSLRRQAREDDGSISPAIVARADD
jgi:uncharacterized protein YciI